MRTWLLLMAAGTLLAGCGKVERGRAPARPGPATASAGTAAAPAAVPGPLAVTDSACPECAGHGFCIRCGAVRPCLLCDGCGACALCGGDGRTRDGDCPACDGGGRCPECAGEGVIDFELGEADAPAPGSCPLCLYGTGLCPDCGGEGVVGESTPCLLCGGAKRCPECRGSGLDVWCGGTGMCPACEGHGSVVQGHPGAGWPPLRLVQTGGEAIVGRVLELPGDSVSIAYSRSGRQVREAFAASQISPLSYLLAARRFLRQGDADAHLRLAEHALRAGDELLAPALRHLAEADRAAGAAASRAAPLRARIERLRYQGIMKDATRALEQDDPRRALLLFRLAKNAVPETTRGRAVEARIAEALATVVAEDAGLSDELRERRRAAEEERLRRAVRRSEDWRARAEAILTATRPDLTSLERAQRAAREAWTSVLRAADRAAPGTDREPARQEGERARNLLVRANVALAQALLERGLPHRARAVGAIALARAPDDVGARAFLAIVEAALARKATEEKGR